MNAPLKPLLLAVLLAAPASAIQVEKLRVARAAALGGGTSETEVVSGEALVRFDAALDAAARKAALAARGAGFVAEVPYTGWTHVTLPSGLSVESGLTVLRTVAGVLEAEPNHAYRVSRIPNDASYSQQYHLAKINAPAAWEYETGGSSRVAVAVLDAGVEGTHPDLSGKFVGNSQFCDPGPTKTTGGGDEVACTTEATATAACNHGTRVAGVAAASSNNGTGVAGVSWDAKLLSLRVFRAADCTSSCGDNGAASCATDDPTIINAINYARSVNNQPAIGRIVLNMSLGEAGTFNCPTALQNSINAAVAGSTGVVIVVAAGNEGTDVTVPASCSGVIPVGATDSNDNIASFSNRGTALANNGLVAPGVGLTTTDLSGGVTGSATGTSFSAPVVAGLAALVIAAKPAYSPTQVRDTMRSSTDGVGVAAVSAAPLGNSAGAGRVNAFKAVKLAVDGTLAGFAGDQKLIAFPNPFKTAESGQATIILPPGLQSRGTSVRVYTIDGQLVRDLKAQTTWDGRNDHGTEVASGVYIVLVKTDAGTQKTKLALIR